MPRGTRRDLTATKNLRESGFFLDKRSFIDIKGHLYLYGRDKSFVCTNVRLKAKKCGICNLPLTPETSEIDHINSGLVDRCDCASNLRAVHFSCHRERHVRIKSAIEEFNGINPAA